MIHVLFISADLGHVATLERLVGPRGRVNRVDPALSDQEIVVAAEATDDVVVIDPSLEADRQLELASRFDRERPDVTVVLLATPSPELLAAALTVGVRDIVDPMGDEADLGAALERAAAAARRRRTQIGELGPAERPSHVITVTSPKGGSGKTTIATNLAVGLARRFPGEVAIVDLDLQFGDVAGALGIDPEHSLTDATRLGERLDLMTLKVFLTPHRSGLYALCPPESLAEADAIEPDQLKVTLARLIEAFPYVVIDTSAGIADQTLTALEMASDLLLVCSTEVPSVRAIPRQVEAFDAVHLTNQRRTFVVNRANARVGLDVADIEATVGLPVSASIPSSKAVVISTNQGEPVIEGDPREPARRAFESLVDLFAPRDAAPAARAPRLFRRDRS